MVKAMRRIAASARSTSSASCRTWVEMRIGKRFTVGVAPREVGLGTVVLRMMML